jgi:hypothetical protein
VVVARTSDGQELYRLLNEDSVRDIAFAPNSSWFATVSNDRRIRIWSTTDGDERLRMSQNSFVQVVKISANGQWLATTGLDKTVRVWNASTGAEMFQIPLKGDGSVLGFSKDGNYLVAGDARGEINIWDISVMPVPQSYLQFIGLTRALQYSPSGDWLAASDDNQVWLLEPEHIHSDRASTGRAELHTDRQCEWNGLQPRFEMAGHFHRCRQCHPVRFREQIRKDDQVYRLGLQAGVLARWYTIDNQRFHRSCGNMGCSERHKDTNSF